MRTVVIGAGGQLGTDIMDTWPADGTVGLLHSDIDVTEPERVLEVLRAHRPDLVVNTAAFHQVDICETEGASAFAVNGLGAMHVASACRELGAAVMFISTDYVFSGDDGRPYIESDAPAPVNVYGMSKAAGEQLVRQRNDRHYVVRTSGLYGAAGASGKGGNFVERMLELARAGKDLRVVDDQVLGPTFTLDLARKLLELAQSGRYGTYHVTSGGSCSWHDFAARIFALTNTPASLSPTTSAEFASPARRPAYSVLENAALRDAGIEPMRPWQEALADYLSRKGTLAASPELAEGRTT